MDLSRDQRSPTQRRLLGFWQAVAVFAVIVVVALLLGAEAMHVCADNASPSVFRSAALAVTGPLAKASDFLRLDRPWEWASGYSGPEVAEVGGGEPTSPDGSEGSVDTSTTTTVSTPTGSTTVTTAAGGAGGSTTTSTARHVTTTTTETLPAFTAENPLRILVVGDSLMTMVGYSLMRESADLPALEVKVITKASSGFVRPDFYDWPKVIAGAVADFKPQVTVMLFGGNEKQRMRSEGQWLEPFTNAWTAEYALRVKAGIEITTATGGRVIWIGMPIMQSSKFSTTARTLNEVYRMVCSMNPRATYIDGYALFADDQGNYSAYLLDSSGKRRLMREDDGIHFTDF